MITGDASKDSSTITGDADNNSSTITGDAGNESSVIAGESINKTEANIKITGNIEKKIYNTRFHRK